MNVLLLLPELNSIFQFLSLDFLPTSYIFPTPSVTCRTAKQITQFPISHVQRKWSLVLRQKTSRISLPETELLFEFIPNQDETRRIVPQAEFMATVTTALVSRLRFNWGYDGIVIPSLQFLIIAFPINCTYLNSSHFVI